MCSELIFYFVLTFTPGGIRGPYLVLGIEPGSAVCIESSLSVVPFFWYMLFYFILVYFIFFQVGHTWKCSGVPPCSDSQITPGAMGFWGYI